MTLLSIDTSTAACSAALYTQGQNIAWRFVSEGVAHAAGLPVFVHELVDEARRLALPIDAVVLSEGPGSYTGLRIGASLAKGLCYGLNIPLLPVPTTELLCAAAQTQIKDEHYILCPMIDARRMEVYTALYDQQLQALTAVEAKIIADESLFDSVREKRVYYFGDGAAKCQALFSSDHLIYLPDCEADTRFMGAWAERKIQAGAQLLQGAELAYYEPFYLKQFIPAPSHIKGLQ